MILGPRARVAFYYAPASEDPLSVAAASWYAAYPWLTEDARRYGFHATLKPPMRLREGCGWADVLDVAAMIATSVPPFALPPLAVADVFGFLALRETEPCPALQAFADVCVAIADPLRALPDEAELARRRRNGLSRAEETNLSRWGYPYVFATFFFHLTLTRRLAAEEMAALRPEAERHFAAALVHARMVSDVCLFVEPEPGVELVLGKRIALCG